MLVLIISCFIQGIVGTGFLVISNIKTMSDNNNDLLSKVFSLCKRRGFIFPSSEIYGGFANTYDFGPYGAELKENAKRLWWDKFIRDREDIYGIDSSIIVNPKIWEASGHIAGFSDVMVEDKVTHQRYRADHLIEDHFQKKGEEIKVDGKPAKELQKIIEKEDMKSPDGNEMTPAREFNSLFETKVGIIVGEENKVYLRGEIAQGLFINFKNILDTMRPKLPFGIGQSGKAFRNEITKGQLTFRTLEFDLMEFEYFFDHNKQKWEELFEYWQKEIYDFALELGLNKDKLRWRPHEEFELAFYSKRTEDLEYEFPWGFKEVFACAYRTDHDLSNHEKHSGQELKYTDEEGKKFIPHVIEPTFGLSRLITILLMDAYKEEEVKGEKRVVLKLDKKIAPIKVAVLPLSRKEELTEPAKKIFDQLKTEFIAEYGETQSIGKRYRRQDEIGTPYCVTFDFDSLKDKAGTVRDRDTLKQKRVKIDELNAYLKEKLA